MRSIRPDCTHPAAARRFVPVPAKAIALLLEAYDCARALRRDLWEFAVELGPLRETGLTNTQLRWLLCKGYVAQAWERTAPGGKQRIFCPVSNLRLCEAACFVLTEAGVAYARTGCPDRAEALAANRPAVLPVWDAARRELRLGRCIVKRFRQPAANQETVLAAFQEEGWPPRIDDPLPPRAEQDGKRRLHSTICNLNRSQQHPLIHFEGGGNGQSVCWRRLNGRGPSEGRAKPERV